MTPPRLQPLRGTVIGGSGRRDPRVFDIPNLPDAVCARVGVMPDVWHHDDLRSAAAKADTKAAIALCNTCVSEADCLAWAIEHGVNEGIFGGKTARQRREISGGRA